MKKSTTSAAVVPAAIFEVRLATLASMLKDATQVCGARYDRADEGWAPLGQDHGRRSASSWG